MFSFLAFSLSRAWQSFWRNAAMSLAATATMTLMLLLLSGFWIVQAGLLAGLDFVEQKVQVVADLTDDATPSAVQALEARINAMPEVAEVDYVSKAEALQRFQATRAAQGEADLTPFLATNPLPASLEIRLRQPDDFGVVTDALRGDPIVQRVKNIADLAAKVTTVTDFLRNAGLALLAVIGAIVLFIVINTIRLAVVGRAEEIEIMRLVGASDAFIRWPFVFEGAMVGLLGAALTLGVLGAAADPLGHLMFDFFRVLPISIGAIAQDVGLLVLGTGLGLGVLGAWISVRTYLIR
ncbi:MAG TPA: permease-like cell division protein FtsX [Candidatus Limnocylindrales bacterium]|nr:permease-like cell division protein FtsX [Candidatus Limnocylindrales bacterium]